MITQALQFFLSLSILIVLHEMGHFFTARWFKMRVEKFYLFFNPWFSIFKVKKGDTEYGLGWLPLGGYVKISGMIDESMDKEQMDKPAEEWEFRSKPAWQRLIVMLGGVTVNAILGVIIYAMVLFTWGEKYLAPQDAKFGIATDSISNLVGFQSGDIIVSLDGDKPRMLRQVIPDMIQDKVETIQVIRNGQPTEIKVDPSVYGVLTNNISKGLGRIGERIPFVVNKVPKDGPAYTAGLQVGDEVIGLNGKQVRFYDEIAPMLSENASKTVTVDIKRGEEFLQKSVDLNKDGKLGINLMPPDSFLVYQKLKYGVLASIPAGASKAYGTLISYVKQFSLIFDKDVKGYKHVGGFISIGGIFGRTWDWERFWIMTALLSIVLAFMNLLPIPALDGGHVMFLLYEMITGRKPHDRVMEIAQMVGMVLILGLLVLANGNDIVKLFQ